MSHKSHKSYSGLGVAGCLLSSQLAFCSLIHIAAHILIPSEDQATSYTGKHQGLCGSFDTHFYTLVLMVAWGCMWVHSSPRPRAVPHCVWGRHNIPHLLNFVLPGETGLWGPCPISPGLRLTPYSRIITSIHKEQKPGDTLCWVRLSCNHHSHELLVDLAA